MQQTTVGWDIGGAHLKAVLLDQCGQVADIALYACPLWKGMAFLEQAAQAVLQQFQGHRCRHVLTMTGELVDLFDNREQGVRRIIEAMRDILADADLSVYAGQRGFLAPETLSAKDCLDIASMNWLASASWTARRIETGIFVDIGSTTTDILLLANGNVDALGLTDYQRLVSKELVYTGIVRTAVMGVTQHAHFKGRDMGLMAEFFATMADVYRLTGDLNEAHDQCDTADGGAKTALASARRLSRMTGYDFNEEDWPLWLDFAHNLKETQKRQVAEACREQMKRCRDISGIKWVGAGIGRFLVREIAEEAGYVYQDFNELLGQTETNAGIDSADCAPAVAVARLAFEETSGKSRSNQFYREH